MTKAYGVIVCALCLLVPATYGFPGPVESTITQPLDDSGRQILNPIDTSSTENTVSSQPSRDGAPHNHAACPLASRFEDIVAYYLDDFRASIHPAISLFNTPTPQARSLASLFFGVEADSFNRYLQHIHAVFEQIRRRAARWERGKFTYSVELCEVIAEVFKVIENETGRDFSGVDIRNDAWKNNGFVLIPPNQSRMSDTRSEREGGDRHSRQRGETKQADGQSTDAASQQQQNLEDEQCTICYGRYRYGDTREKLECGHEFHDRCIERWRIKRPELDGRAGQPNDQHNDTETSQSRWDIAPPPLSRRLRRRSQGEDARQHVPNVEPEESDSQSSLHSRALWPFRQRNRNRRQSSFTPTSNAHRPSSSAISAFEERHIPYYDQPLSITPVMMDEHRLPTSPNGGNLEQQEDSATNLTLECPLCRKLTSHEFSTTQPIQNPYSPMEISAAEVLFIAALAEGITFPPTKRDPTRRRWKPPSPQQRQASAPLDGMERGEAKKSKPRRESVIRIQTDSPPQPAQATTTTSTHSHATSPSSSTILPSTPTGLTDALMYGLAAYFIPRAQIRNVRTPDSPAISVDTSLANFGTRIAQARRAKSTLAVVRRSAHDCVNWCAKFRMCEMPKRVAVMLCAMFMGPTLVVVVYLFASLIIAPAIHQFRDQQQGSRGVQGEPLPGQF